MNVRVKFLGGAGTVTGSKYLLEIDHFKLLIDCGLFQGLKELRLRNWEPLPIDVAEINAVVLTHAHLDHSGYLPRLVKDGYNGPVYCTDSTADLLTLLLLDSAKLQEEEAEFAKKKGYSKHENPQPLYNTHDVHEMLPLVKSCSFHKSIYLTPQIAIHFRRAGHILGASIVEVILEGETQQKNLIFSGDLGREEDPILNPPEHIKKADILFVESTYGDRENPFVDVKDDMARIINETMQRKGCVLIPAFSVGRTQNMLMFIKDLMADKAIPEMDVFMDSPMAIAATDIYIRHKDDHKLSEEVIKNDDSFLTLGRNLVMVQTQEASRYLNDKTGGAIIISASGMMSGGRILHHLFHRLQNKHDTLMIVGFQAAGTRGRRIIDGEKFVKIFGQLVPVNCHVEIVNGLSAHADKPELFTWLSHIEDSPKLTFVIHGEEESAAHMSREIQRRFGWNTFVPNYLENVELFQGI
jgi:metallo-beta-lactamase family protein